MNIKIRLAACAAGLCLLFSVAGCDTVQDSSDIVTLPVKEAFTLEFDGAALDPVKPADKHSGPETIANDISGFRKEEIVAAGIAGIRVERLQPASVNLGEIIGGELVVYLEGTNAGRRVQIGRLEAVPDENTVNVPVAIDGQLVPVLKADDYRVALRFTPAESPPDANVRMAVDVDFEVTFEGL